MKDFWLEFAFAIGGGLVLLIGGAFVVSPAVAMFLLFAYRHNFAWVIGALAYIVIIAAFVATLMNRADNS